LPCWVRELAISTEFVPGIYSTAFGFFSTGPDGVTRMLLLDVHHCECGMRTCFAINRDGTSRCIRCDLEYQQGALDGGHK
jgi:hypothetical protein